VLVLDQLNAVVSACEWPANAAEELDRDGVTTLPGPVPAAGLAELSAAYDAAVSGAAPDDIKVGSTTTRVRDFVNRGAAFDGLYLYPPVLKACCRLIDAPFRLSTMHARTLRPGAVAQDLHVDFARDESGWTMVGFILMVDEFRSGNGATRFVPGSHLWPATPSSSSIDLKGEYPGQKLACGPAGSMIVFNGAIWHGHTANRSGLPRRSIQGAYIRREAESGENLRQRMLPETLARISALAKYVLAV
jgi:Phytanoyl-CoA dioxygenase (PhyH)